MRLLTLLFAVLLSGCAAIGEEIRAYQALDKEPVPQDNYIPGTNEGLLHTYVEILARQLFDTSGNIDPARPLIVGTFLPANSLMEPSNNELKLFGIQLQESFATLATQAGLKVIEFKSLSGVMITDKADVMLSRDLNKLDKTLNAQYLLTGNYIEQESSLLVNVKLISVHDKSLVAAATGNLPFNSFYSDSKVKMKDGLLYRGQY